jgi:hypothetical protein
MKAPKWVSRVVTEAGSTSCTRVTEVVVETKHFWLVETEGWRGTFKVMKNGKGGVKPYMRQPY